MAREINHSRISAHTNPEVSTDEWVASLVDGSAETGDPHYLTARYPAPSGAAEFRNRTLSGGFLFAWPPPEVSLPAPPPFSPVTGGGRTPWRPSHAPLFRHASPPIATTWCRSRPLTISVRLPPPSFLHSSPSALASTTFPHLLLLLL
ncbi:hypothetical protein B296_00046572 [Ensete ventricosum]|uniref:Uncharacterized protein n=1 Tax=Ensete ventricosum TaxID=4639 RepID=A0A426YA13_ENSVE|nr:hypothetical protein B296_00046572 [Ensete ventricosum]